MGAPRPISPGNSSSRPCSDWGRKGLGVTIGAAITKIDPKTMRRVNVTGSRGENAPVAQEAGKVGWRGDVEETDPCGCETD